MHRVIASVVIVVLLMLVVSGCETLELKGDAIIVYNKRGKIIQAYYGDFEIESTEDVVRFTDKDNGGEYILYVGDETTITIEENTRPRR